MAEEGIGNKGLKTKLIVNYLPQSMSDGEFQALFSAIGGLESVKVMRDKKTNYSFGYGFVDYTNELDAETAISKLNGYKILNKTLRVAYSKPPGSSKNVNLYISGLTPSTDERKLEELFRPYGDIVYTRILRNQDGSSKSVGFVLFKDKDNADAAIRSLQGHTDTGGMKLHIKYAKDSTDQNNPHPKFQEFLQQKFMAQNQQQQQVFNQGGGGMGQGSGYGGMGGNNMGGGSGMGGFQQFPSQPMYQDPYGGGSFGGAGPIPNYMGGDGGQKTMRGRDVSQRFNPISRPGLQGQGMGMGMGGMGAGGGGMGGQGMAGDNDTNLFCYFGQDPSDAEVYALFSKYGRISKVDVIKGKGYAFVHMPIAQEANEALMSLNGSLWHDSKVLQVSVRKK